MKRLERELSLFPIPKKNKKQIKSRGDRKIRRTEQEIQESFSAPRGKGVLDKSYSHGRRKPKWNHIRGMGFYPREIDPQTVHIIYDYMRSVKQVAYGAFDSYAVDFRTKSTFDAIFRMDSLIFGSSWWKLRAEILSRYHETLSLRKGVLLFFRVRRYASYALDYWQVAQSLD